VVAALTSKELRSALEKWHVPATFTSGWSTRSAYKSGWSDVTGCMYHHTANDASDSANRALITNGYSGLPGPLANFGVTDTGRIDVIAVGPANHAGGGDSRVLDAVRQESYGARPPDPRYTHSEAVARGEPIGNRMFYGWESYYGAGGDKIPEPLQHRVTILSMAAIIDALDRKDTKNTWSAKSMIGHKEWQRGKIDPLAVVMAAARAELQWCLDNGPDAAYNWYKTGEQGDDMADIDAIATAVAKKVLNSKLIKIIGKDPAEYMSLNTAARVTYDRVVNRIPAQLAGQDAKLAEMAAILSELSGKPVAAGDIQSRIDAAGERAAATCLEELRATPDPEVENDEG